eukprot:CAMPEP_0172520992 /NCGR_PEP_ID=MMETSP1066-20121228/292318_1 /TAXON_ID=671091 /ORGANISM="Coscinodiscus wailesii, Strain CCMP2513" /LENGTH=238 /DNA_ID=CAMNT_0013303823 /DNA_START=1 /DNA_END=713 /DNA_ORIENTATION=-
MTLAGLLDDMLGEFLFWLMDKDDVMVVLVSDHGLHYGSYFLSRAGERERQEPLLYLHLPSSAPKIHDSWSDSSSFGKLEFNKWVTPYDVHETIVDIALNTYRQGNDVMGVSLLKEAPKRDACEDLQGIIPDKYCQFHNSLTSKMETCQTMPFPPSMTSFFADIPKENKPVWPSCGSTGDKTSSKQQLLLPQKGKKCLCATNQQDWYKCQTHPWQQMNVKDYVGLVDCVGETLQVDIRV